MGQQVNAVKSQAPYAFPIQGPQSQADRASLFAIKEAVGWFSEQGSGYNYLEFGSGSGETLYQHLADKRCLTAYSVDPRDRIISENGQIRGIDLSIEKSKKMLKNLSDILPSGSLEKRLECLEFGSDAQRALFFGMQADLFYLNNSVKTSEAYMRDFDLALSLSPYGAVYVFQDAHLVPEALEYACESTKAVVGEDGFNALALPDSIFVIERNFPAHREQNFSLFILKESYKSFVHASKIGHTGYMNKLNAVRYLYQSLMAWVPK